MAKKGTFTKGDPRAGRPKGTPNKATQEFRLTVQKLLDENTENVSRWLAVVAKTNPARALDLLAHLAEFAAPKLSRTELTGDQGKPIEVQIVRYSEK